MNRDSAFTSDHGTAKGERQPYSGPGEGRAAENRLHEVGLDDRGESLEDRQRDRDSNGVAGGYDDSIATRKHADVDRAGTTDGD
ncbi:MAG TPA: hypothetical protein VFE72_12975 [Lysobacter sp.]|nr:hypothetical protein [Lysobacter sp.]